MKDIETKDVTEEAPPKPRGRKKIVETITITEPEVINDTSAIQELTPHNVDASDKAPINLRDFDLNKFEEIKKFVASYGIDVSGLDRQGLKAAMLEYAKKEFLVLRDTGVLEVVKDTTNQTQGWGYLRHDNLDQSPYDIYISHSQITKFGLKTGDIVTGLVRSPKANEKFHSLLRVEDVNNINPEINKSRAPFEELTPIYPDQQYKLELTKDIAKMLEIENNNSLRVIDIFAPIGKGTRGLIVAPPKAGKTTLIKDIAKSLVTKYPDIYLIILLVDERPEEVTDIKRSVKNRKNPDNVKFISSTFDEHPDNHMRVSDMVLNISKRLVESGHDVVILLDSITRMARASNLTVAPSGKILSGGLDPASLYRPKRFIGAARNIEDGGSLTVIATALVDTGSRMDDSIFEEFKATGNMELVLDRSLAEKRIYPAIDIKRSSTRHDEKLYSNSEYQYILNLQKAINASNLNDESELIIRLIENTDSNAEFMLKAQKTIESISNRRK